ncbi:hypothetical protein C8Q75DRAFT_794249 [Abortiporus biennis]|nr:hypothetical protein C8Q75DRAFT_794249 [Abortiporus biennis]
MVINYNTSLPFWIEFCITVYNLWSLETQFTIWRHLQSLSPAIDFMRHGYLVKTPQSPTSAIAIRTLELFYHIQQRKPSFSVEAFAKVICDYYMMSSPTSLTSVYRVLTDTYEIYLQILLAIEEKVRAALGWIGDNWRVNSSCHACCYKLANEPPILKWMRMFEKWTVADSWTFVDSDYYLPASFINQFSNEVQCKPPPVNNTLDYTTSLVDKAEDGDDEGLLDDGNEGDPTNGNDDDALHQYMRNWKSAASEEKKKMWAIFDETGIFASACCHGLILWITDMVSMVSKVIDTLEPHILRGYDIRCSFQETIKKSSLGNKFINHRSKLCVNAFHGYTYCYQCQLVHHPSIIEGTGLEDLETLEHIFSASNELASITHKYTNLGKFILDNLKQAYKIINEDTLALKDSMAKSNPPVFDHNLDLWEKEEVAFFTTLGEESYVELLQDLQFVTSVPSNYTFSADHAPSYTRDASNTARLKTQRRQINEQYDLHLGIHDVTQRWTPSTPKYHRLHCLIFSSTGYKLRTHISKSLQTRCKTIRYAAMLLHRELIKLRQKITCTHEEALCCKVEVKCIHTAIRDKYRLFSMTLMQLLAKQDRIYGAVKDFAARRQAINFKILQ